jgi:hypothetical protein
LSSTSRRPAYRRARSTKRTVVGRRAIVDYEPVEAARERIREAAEGVRSLRAPTSAVHHRGHLVAALTALKSALAAALSATDQDALC